MIGIGVTLVPEHAAARKAMNTPGVRTWARCAQRGNVWEWNEAAVDSLYRGVRGESLIGRGVNLQPGTCI